jgi:alpha-L-fucosidase
MLSVHELVRSLADIVSKNGNLLLDIGPEADGSVSKLQLERLTGLGDWLAMNGEAIFDSSPWFRAEGSTQSGIPIRFTQKDGVLYAILLAKPAGKSVTIADLPIVKNSFVQMLGFQGNLHWSQADSKVTIALPDPLPGSEAWVLKIPIRQVKAAALHKPEIGRPSLLE